MEEKYTGLQIINNFYISLEEQRVSRKRTIPQQVNFEFNPENLDAVNCQVPPQIYVEFRVMQNTIL